VAPLRWIKFYRSLLIVETSVMELSKSWQIVFKHNNKDTITIKSKFLRVVSSRDRCETQLTLTHDSPGLGLGVKASKLPVVEFSVAVFVEALQQAQDFVRWEPKRLLAQHDSSLFQCYEPVLIYVEPTKRLFQQAFPITATRLEDLDMISTNVTRRHHHHHHYNVVYICMLVFSHIFLSTTSLVNKDVYIMLSAQLSYYMIITAITVGCVARWLERRTFLSHARPAADG